MAGVIYDLTDDWAAFESDAARRASVQTQIEALASDADLVLACSHSLEEQARLWSSHVVYLPNAVGRHTAVPTQSPEVAELPAPRLGYAGTLHSSRIDIPLLVEAANLRPTWSFVFLGPDMLEPLDRRSLFGLANVHHLGVRPHADVLSYVSAFDVCLHPNRVTDFTRSLDPLKFYEYLATGRPVIATPAGIPHDLSDHITTAVTGRELVSKVERLLSEDSPSKARSRRMSVADATWESRARQIEESLGAVPPAQTVDVSVVVVSFNTRELLKRCLGTLRSERAHTLQIVVVDNGSTDGTQKMIRQDFPDVQLLELSRNTGFAHANNVAFDHCRGKQVLLLNSDAYVHPGAIGELLAASARHPSAGVIGPRLVNPDGSLQRSAWPFPGAPRLLLEAFGAHRILRRMGLLEDLGTWGHNEERPIDFLSGACLLVRAEALQEVGGFDEQFWMYGEEADLQRRLSRRGWCVVFTPRAVVTHVGGGSSHQAAPRMWHFYSGQRRFLQKHRLSGSWPAARFALLIGSVLRRRWVAARIALKLR
jgi:GT2 family glycosyltransferase